MTQFATFLMFCGPHHGKAEEAVNRYVSLFDNARIESLERWGAGGSEPAGTCKRADFQLNGQRFMAMDSAGPHRFTFTPATSIFVDCDSEDQLERLFAALSEGGAVLMALDSYGFSRAFGWVNDRFGVSWQLNFRG